MDLIEKNLHRHTLTLFTEHFPSSIVQPGQDAQTEQICHSVQQLKYTRWGNQSTNSVLIVCSTLKWDAGESILSLKSYMPSSCRVSVLGSKPFQRT